MTARRCGVLPGQPQSAGRCSRPCRFQQRGPAFGSSGTSHSWDSVLLPKNVVFLSLDNCTDPPCSVCRQSLPATLSESTAACPTGHESRICALRRCDYRRSCACHQLLSDSCAPASFVTMRIVQPTCHTSRVSHPIDSSAKTVRGWRAMPQPK